MTTDQTMTKKTYLFQEFNPVSAKEWKQQIQMELKGADYNDILVWQSLEGIDVKPFYHNENYEFLNIPKQKSDFIICQSIFIDDPEKANKIAHEVLSKGVESIEFITKDSFDLDVLFQGFKELKNKPKIFFNTQFLSSYFISDLFSFSKDLDINIQIDILGNLASTGNWYDSEKRDFSILEKSLEKHTTNNILKVDASTYQNAGATSVQQVAYALSHALEYLVAFDKKKINVIQVEFAVGSNYFFEIAKLRSFRYLWQELIKEYNLDIPLIILAKPSLRNKTLYDYNVNMLRTSTEYMSAVLGGADVINAQPYDYIFKKSNSFSNRIARNQLLVLREENGFITAQNFSKGSYYIETLTLEIAKKSLQLFKEIEKQGGFLSALKAGVIQRKIQESAQKEQELFDKGEITLLGTNKYPNSEDKMKEEMELYPFLKSNKTQTKIKPILAKRLAEKMEQERIANE